jgi:hypothetical protein
MGRPSPGREQVENRLLRGRLCHCMIPFRGFADLVLARGRGIPRTWRATTLFKMFFSLI